MGGNGMNGDLKVKKLHVAIAGIVVPIVFGLAGYAVSQTIKLVKVQTENAIILENVTEIKKDVKDIKKSLQDHIIDPKVHLPALNLINGKIDAHEQRIDKLERNE